MFVSSHVSIGWQDFCLKQFYFFFNAFSNNAITVDHVTNNSTTEDTWPLHDTWHMAYAGISLLEIDVP